MALPVDRDDAAADPDVVVGVPAGRIVAVEPIVTDVPVDDPVEPMVDPVPVIEPMVDPVPVVEPMVDPVPVVEPMEPVNMVPSRPTPFPWTMYVASFIVVAGTTTGTVVACVHEAWSAAMLTALVATVTVVAMVVHATNECHWLRHDPLNGTVRDVDRLRRPRRRSPVALDTCVVVRTKHQYTRDGTRGDTATTSADLVGPSKYCTDRDGMAP